MMTNKRIFFFKKAKNVERIQVTRAESLVFSRKEDIRDIFKNEVFRDE